MGTSCDHDCQCSYPDLILHSLETLNAMSAHRFLVFDSVVSVVVAAAVVSVVAAVVVAFVASIVAAVDQLSQDPLIMYCRLPLIIWSVFATS